MAIINNTISFKEAISLLIEEKTKYKHTLDTALDLSKIIDDKKLKEKLKTIHAYDLAISALKELDTKSDEINKEISYKEAWEILKKEVNSNREYYEDGSVCSLSESIHGERLCKEFLKDMESIEYFIKEKG